MRIKYIFIDKEGRLMLAWRILLYLIAIIFIAATVPKLVVYPISTKFPLGTQLVSVLLSIIATLGITYLFRKFIDKRDWAGMALPKPSGVTVRNLMLGFMIGTAMLLLVFGIEVMANWVRVVGTELDVSTVPQVAAYLTVGLISFFAVGFLEELMMRGYIFQNLGEKYTIGLAALINALLFGLMHSGNAGFSVTFLLSAMMLTLFLTISRLLTGSIWWAIGWHTAWNWWQTTVLGLSEVNTPDYHHAFLHLSQKGPNLMVGIAPSIEGGLLIAVIISLAAMIAFTRLPSRKIWWMRLSEKGTTL